MFRLIKKLLKVLLWLVVSIIALVVLLVIIVSIDDANIDGTVDHAHNEKVETKPIKAKTKEIISHKIINEHLKRNQLDNLFEDISLYPEERNYLDSIIFNCADFSEATYSQLRKYSKYASEDSLLVNMLDSLMSKMESDTFYKISNMSSIEELADYYRENLEDVPYLEDYLRDVIVLRIKEVPYPVAKELHESFHDTPAGQRIDSLFYSVKDSLLEVAVSELQEEFDKEIYVLNQMRLMTIQDVASCLEPKIIAITDTILDKANEDYLGSVIGLLVDEINDFLDEKLNDKMANRIRNSTSKAMNTITKSTTKGYQWIDNIVTYLGDYTDTSFLSNVAEPIWMRLTPNKVRELIPELDFLYNFRYHADTLSGRIVYSPADDFDMLKNILPFHQSLDLPDFQMNSSIPPYVSWQDFRMISPDMQSTCIPFKQEAFWEKQIEDSDSFKDKFVLLTLQHLCQFCFGEGLCNYVVRLCETELGMDSVCDSVLNGARKYSAAVNRNRYDLMTEILDVSVDTSALYILPIELSKSTAIVEIPLKKIEIIQRLKYREFIFDTKAFISGVVAGIALPFKWGLLYDLGDFACGMYVGMKVTNLVGEDVQIFGQELTQRVVESCIDYVNSVYDALEEYTLKTQETTKEYLYENF